MKISVVIPTKNRKKALFLTLDSLYDQTLAPDLFEILIIDSSTDNTPQLIRDDLGHRPSLPSVRVIPEERKGVHFARHRGAHEMKGEYFVQLEDDAVADEKWLENLIKPFEQNSKIVCVGGRVLPRFEVSPPLWMKPFLGLLTVYDLGEKPLFPPYIAACNMAIQKKILFAAGGFNPDIMGNELIGNGEVGLVEKIHAARLGEVLYVPNAIVWHLIPRSRLTEEYFEWRVYNEGTCTVQTYFQKWKPNRIRVVILAFLRLGDAFKNKMLASFFSRKKNFQYYRRKFNAMRLRREALAFWQLAYDTNYRQFLAKKDWIHERAKQDE